MLQKEFFENQSFDFNLINITYNRSKIGSFQYGPRHSFELYYKIDGASGKQIFDNIEFEIPPDCIMFLPNGSTNASYSYESCTYILIYFSLYGEANNRLFNPQRFLLKPGNNMKNLFFQAYELWSKKDPGNYQLAHAVVNKIFANLIADSVQKYVPNSKYTKIEPALVYVREHYRDPISVSSLAEMCNISDQYFRTLFRSYTGQTPLSYINTLRLEYARDLLQNEILSISEIAHQSGFDSPEYFSRLFKQHYNLSPSKVNTIKISTPDIFYQNKEKKQP